MYSRFGSRLVRSSGARSLTSAHPSASSSSSSSSSSASSSSLFSKSSSLSSSSLLQHTSPSRHFSHGIVQHRDTPDNTAATPFSWTPENATKVDKILKKFPTNYKQSAVMPLLTLAQEQNANFLTLSAMNHIATQLSMPPIRVYEVACFYSMYNRERLGKYHLQVCGTTPCMLCGAQEIISALEKHLHIKKGETTSDGMFTLTEVECLGACVNAPMLQVNNHEFYEDLTPATVVKLTEDLKAGKAKIGPQNHRKAAEGPKGKTSLQEQPKPWTRDLDALKKQVKEEQEKAAAAAAAAKKP